MSVNYSRQLPGRREFHINVMFNVRQQRLEQYPGKAGCQEGSVSAH